jgi:hypothetical protein
VQIARRTLNVQTTDISATGSVSTDYQFAFKPKDTALRLVALRSESTVRAADGRPKRNEKARLGPPAPVPLADFTFDPAALDDDARPEPAVAAGASISGS